MGNLTKKRDLKLPNKITLTLLTETYKTSEEIWMKNISCCQLLAFHCILLFNLLLSLNGSPPPFIIPINISYLYIEELLCMG